ncbi:hypothetical protein DFH09DRAFT_1074737 [Mycena vulgaris]|nr:hypothetical protein DFH09DRAFT_1074737 [Mycena vulgaris]
MMAETQTGLSCNATTCVLPRARPTSRGTMTYSIPIVVGDPEEVLGLCRSHFANDATNMEDDNHVFIASAGGRGCGLGLPPVLDTANYCEIQSPRTHSFAAAPMWLDTVIHAGSINCALTSNSTPEDKDIVSFLVSDAGSAADRPWHCTARADPPRQCDGKPELQGLPSCADERSDAANLPAARFGGKFLEGGFIVISTLADAPRYDSIAAECSVNARVSSSRVVARDHERSDVILGASKLGAEALGASVQFEREKAKGERGWRTGTFPQQQYHHDEGVGRDERAGADGENQNPLDQTVRGRSRLYLRAVVARPVEFNIFHNLYDRHAAMQTSVAAHAYVVVVRTMPSVVSFVWIMMADAKEKAHFQAENTYMVITVALSILNFTARRRRRGGDGGRRRVYKPAAFARKSCFAGSCCVDATAYRNTRFNSRVVVLNSLGRHVRSIEQLWTGAGAVAQDEDSEEQIAVDNGKHVELNIWRRLHTSDIVVGFNQDRRNSSKSGNYRLGRDRIESLRSGDYALLLMRGKADYRGHKFLGFGPRARTATWKGTNFRVGPSGAWASFEGPLDFRDRALRSPHVRPADPDQRLIQDCSQADASMIITGTGRNQSGIPASPNKASENLRANGNYRKLRANQTVARE